MAEVTHVSKHGFSLLLDREELLVPFREFPWLEQATIEQLSDVQWPNPNHLYWPQLDVDLSVESIRDPAAIQTCLQRFWLDMMNKSIASDGPS